MKNKLRTIPASEFMPQNKFKNIELHHTFSSLSRTFEEQKAQIDKILTSPCLGRNLQVPIEKKTAENHRIPKIVIHHRILYQ